MVRIAFLFPILLTTFFSNAQNEVTVQHACSFNHEITNKTFLVLAPSRQAEEIVNNILSVTDLPISLDLIASDCKEVLATKIGNQRVILYNPDFIKEFYISSERKWSVYVAMAHAIGHHVKGTI